MSKKDERILRYMEKQAEKDQQLYEKELNNPNPTTLIRNLRRNKQVEKIIYDPTEIPKLTINYPAYRSTVWRALAIFNDGFQYAEAMESDAYFLLNTAGKMLRVATTHYERLTLSSRRQKVFVKRAIAYHYEKWVEQEGKETPDVEKNVKISNLRAQEVIEKFYCRMCGEQIPIDSIFCPCCGEKVIKGPQ